MKRNETDAVEKKIDVLKKNKKKPSFFSIFLLCLRFDFTASVLSNTRNISKSSYVSSFT